MWSVFIISSISVLLYYSLNCSLSLSHGKKLVFGNGTVEQLCVYDKCHHKTRETKNASG